MSGIKITNSKTKLPHALKLCSAISSYLFEEECGELGYFTTKEKELLKKASKMLSKKAYSILK